MMLNIYPLRVRFSATKSQSPIRYAGSAWRGGFGHALKKLVCIFKNGHCQGCPLNTSCAYTTVFESSLTAEASRGIPSPYTLYPVSTQHETQLYMTITGDKAISSFPFILHALRVAGAQGVGHREFSFEAVEQFDGTDWKQLDAQPTPLPALPPQAPAHVMTLRLITPVRFKHEGRFVGPDRMTLALWLRALQRRLISLAASWGNEAAMRQLCAVGEVGEWLRCNLHWQEMERYSSRQHTAMKIGGVAGSFVLSREQLQTLWPLLWLGQWVQTGKFTTMGMGRYEMIALDRECEE